MRILLIVFLVISTGTSGAIAQESKTDRAIRAVKELCLTGKQFDLRADAKGNLTFLKLAPGGEGSASVNVRTSSGAAAIFDDKVRQIADEDIRRCIQPHMSRIIDSILGEPLPVPSKTELLRQEIVKFASTKDAETRALVGEIRYANISTQECMTVRAQIDQFASPTIALEPNARRLPDGMSEDQLMQVQNRMVEGANSTNRTIRFLVENGISKGCIAR